MIHLGIAAPFTYLRSIHLHIKGNLDGTLKSRKTHDLRTYTLLVGERPPVLKGGLRVFAEAEHGTERASSFLPFDGRASWGRCFCARYLLKNFHNLQVQGTESSQNVSLLRQSSFVIFLHLAL